jgi:hypothetical protein
MKRVFPLLISAILSCATSFAQVNPTGRLLEEGQLFLTTTGSTTVSDPTAFGGTAMFRSASSPNDTYWYGPYSSFQAGNYLVQFRLKVASNTSSQQIIILDVCGNGGNIIYVSVGINPAMFRNANEWQLFTLPVVLPANISDIEIRGVGFVTGITDLYLDHISIIPGDARGFYSSELTISGGGNVGIGTMKINDPNYRLFVEKGIRTRKVKVDQAAWPDFVFHPGYRVRPLSEIEQFIQQHQHLPDVPSAAEVEKEGLDLGDNQATLLKKIEELTLYVIEQNKQMAEQQKQTYALRRQVAELQAMISKRKNK